MCNINVHLLNVILFLCFYTLGSKDRGVKPKKNKEIVGVTRGLIGLLRQNQCFADQDGVKTLQYDRDALPQPQEQNIAHETRESL